MITVNGDPIRYDLAPVNCQDTLRAYIEQGVHPGGFLTAFLCGDLFDAMARADDINQHQFYSLTGWLYNYAPSGCYGSPQKVAEWMKARRMEGVRP